MRELRRLLGWSSSGWCSHVLAAACLVLGPGAAHADWECSVWWSAYTGDRVMLGTHEECGPWCWWPHSCGNSWVDIVGGVSHICDNHNQTFAGWTGDQSSEWNMCAPWTYQESQGERQVASVNQAWDRFPYLWGCPLPDTVWMNDPFFTVYDLVGCSTCEPGQSCECPGGCTCDCSAWTCNPWDTDDWGQGRCERTVTATKYPSCQGGNTNNQLCSSFKVVGDCTCVWNWE